MTAFQVVYTNHARERVMQRGVPPEVLAAMRRGNCSRVRILASFERHGEACIVRASAGFWIHVCDGPLIFTVYCVPAGQRFVRWCRDHLANPSEIARLLRLRPQLSWRQRITDELAEEWLAPDERS